MLGLLAPTDPSWVAAVEQNYASFLSDHAHCELKAAQNALSVAGRFAGEYPEIVAPLVSLAKEEAAHFDDVAKRTGAHGSRIGRPSVDEYVNALRTAAHQEGQVAPLLARLLIAAVIEARSCERFRLLSETLSNLDLRPIYRDLMIAEARHFRFFTTWAETLFGQAEARDRLEALARREAEIVALLPLGPEVHG